MVILFPRVYLLGKHEVLNINWSHPYVRMYILHPYVTKRIKETEAETPSFAANRSLNLYQRSVK